MLELWDLYDENRKLIKGKVAKRDLYIFKEKEYHIVVQCFILNMKNQILITKRADFKPYGGYWECNGGSVLKGETSLDGMLREIREEIGITFKAEDAVYLKEVKSDRYNNFKDIWLFKKDIKSEQITFPDGEAVDFKWVSIDEFEEMLKDDRIVHSVDIDRNDYNKAIELIKNTR